MYNWELCYAKNPVNLRKPVERLKRIQLSQHISYILWKDSSQLSKF